MHLWQCVSCSAATVCRLAPAVTLLLDQRANYVCCSMHAHAAMQHRMLTLEARMPHCPSRSRGLLL
jgi:hypothetical protein